VHGFLRLTEGRLDTIARYCSDAKGALSNAQSSHCEIKRRLAKIHAAEQHVPVAHSPTAFLIMKSGLHHPDFIQEINQHLAHAERRARQEVRYAITRQPTPKMASFRLPHRFLQPKGILKMQIYVEPLPKGRWGPIDGYALEYPDGTKITNQVFRSEKLAVSEVKLRGYKPLLAKVRITDKRDATHWEATD
jgi:hypothetical protein